MTLAGMVWALVAATATSHVAQTGYVPCDLKRCSCAGVSLASVRGFGAVPSPLQLDGQQYHLAICEPVDLQSAGCTPGGDSRAILANASVVQRGAHGACFSIGDSRSMVGSISFAAGHRWVLRVRLSRGKKSLTISFAPGTDTYPTNLSQASFGHWETQWLAPMSLSTAALTETTQFVEARRAENSSLDLAKSSDSAQTCAAYRKPDDPECQPLYAQFATNTQKCTLMSWQFNNAKETIEKMAIQILLFFLSLASLIWKKHLEDRHAVDQEQDLGRDAQEFYLDVAKQGIAELCAHVLHYCTSVVFHRLSDEDSSDGKFKISNECSWYFITYTLDTVVGTFLSICLLQLAARGLCRCSSMRRLGEYRRHRQHGHDDGQQDGGNWNHIDWILWAKQTLIWCAFVVGTRVLIFGVIFCARAKFQWLSDIIAAWFVCAQTLLLAMVTIVCPTIMNIVQLLIQDIYLQGRLQRDRGPRDSDRGVHSHDHSRYSRPPPPVPQLGDDSEEDWTSVRTGLSDLSDSKYDTARRRCCALLLGLILSTGSAIVAVHVYDAVYTEDYYYDRCSSHIDFRAQDFTHPENFKFTDPAKTTRHDFSKAFQSTCVEPNVGGRRDLTIKTILEHRLDLLQNDNKDCGSDFPSCNSYNAKPACICCNQKEPSDFTMPCEVETTTKDNHYETQTRISCPSVGTCCARVELMSSPSKAARESAEKLQEECQICPLYFPCDQKYCPARSDEIRSTQHTPMVVGALLSLLANVYVVYTYAFDEQLKRATIAKLLASAAVVAIVFTGSVLVQEFLFRIPIDPWVPDEDGLRGQMPDPYQSIYGWPTWEAVANAREQDPNNRNGGRGQAVKNCAEMSFVVQFTWTASDGFYFMVTVDMILDLFTSPFGSSRKRMWWYQGIVLTLSFCTATVLRLSGQWGVSDHSILEDFCWNVNFGHKNTDRIWSWGIIYGMTIFFYFMSFCAAGAAYNKASSLTQGMREARKETIQRAAYVASAGAVWAGIMAAVYLWVLSPGNADNISKYLNTTHLIDQGSENYGNAPNNYKTSAHAFIVRTFAFVVGFHNVINFLIFRFIVIPDLNHPDYGMFLGIQLRCCRQRSEDSQGSDGTGIQLNEHLQNELLFFTGLGIRSACRWDHRIVDLEYPEQLSIHERRTSSFLPRKTASALSELLRVHGDEPSPLPSDSKFEARPEHRMILVDVIKANAKEQALSEELRRTEGHDPRRDFKQNMDRMFQGARSIALQRPLNELNGDQLKQLDKEKYLQNRQLAKITFRTYVPAKFRELRELFGIDAYGNRGRGALHEAMSEHKPGSFNGGASGAFMYSSNDGRFIVKQISKQELLVLLNMLDGYMRHMRKPIENDIVLKKIDNGQIGQAEAEKQGERDRLEKLTVHYLLAEADRLDLTQRDQHGNRTEWGLKSHLPRLLQCNRIQMYHTEVRCCQNLLKGGRLYFVVMEDTFHKHVTREAELRQMRSSHCGFSLDRIRAEVEAGITKFDLKGSSVNRSTLPSDHDDASHLADSTTLKDLDLREKLYLSETDSNELIEQLKDDTDFLCRCNIMDYSLLLGIQKGVNSQMQNRLTGGFEQGPALGRLEAVASHSARRYYVGIIDILQRWDTWKSCEPWLKSLVGPMRYENFNAYELSSVDPKYYRKRFIVRMMRHIDAKQPVGTLASTADAVDRIATNLTLDTSQREQLAARVDAADGGDLFPALVATESELRHRSSGIIERGGGGARAAAYHLAPEPEPEPEPELEPEPEPEVPIVGVTRAVSPAWLGGSE